MGGGALGAAGGALDAPEDFARRGVYHAHAVALLLAGLDAIVDFDAAGVGKVGE